MWFPSVGSVGQGCADLWDSLHEFFFLPSRKTVWLETSGPTLEASGPTLEASGVEVSK